MIRLATVFFRFFPTHDLRNRVANTLMVADNHLSLWIRVLLQRFMTTVSRSGHLEQVSFKQGWGIVCKFAGHLRVRGGRQLCQGSGRPEMSDLLFRSWWRLTSAYVRLEPCAKRSERLDAAKPMVRGTMSPALNRVYAIHWR